MSQSPQILEIQSICFQARSKAINDAYKRIFAPQKNFREIGLFVYYQIRYMQLTRWTIACVTIFGCNSLCSIVCKFKWHWKKVYSWVRKLQKISRAFSNVDTIYRSWFIQTTLNKWILKSSIDHVGHIENTLFSYSQLYVDHNQGDQFVDWNCTPPQWMIAFPLSKVLKMLTSYVS